MMKLKKRLNYESRLRTLWDKKEFRTPMQEFLYNRHREYYAERHPVLSVIKHFIRTVLALLKH